MKGAIRLDCGMYLPQTFTQITFTLYYIPRKAKQRQQIKKNTLSCEGYENIWINNSLSNLLENAILSTVEHHTTLPYRCIPVANWSVLTMCFTWACMLTQLHLTSSIISTYYILHRPEGTHYFLAGDRTKFPPQTFPHLMYNYWSKSPVDSLPGLPVFFNVMWEKSKNNIKRLEHAAKYPVHTRLREIAVRRGRTWNDLHAQNPGKANPVPAQAFPTLSERLN